MNTKNESYVIGKERCPSCARKGKDTSGDNLAIYSDGHKYCFSCGYLDPGTVAQRIYDKSNLKKKPEEKPVILPDDITKKLDLTAIKWLLKYLDQKEFPNNIFWSPSKKYLIFPYFDINNTLIAWQGRYFGDNPDYPKWVSYGKIHEILHILPYDGPNLGYLVLVEDIISALKVSKHMSTMPVFGSVIPPILLTRLSLLGYNNIIIWLDPDKRQESMKFSQHAKQYGFNVKTIFSDKDPKDLSHEEIYKLLYNN